MALERKKYEGHEVDLVLRKDVTEPRMSDWASLVVIAPRKDEKLRSCVECGKLNAVTVSDTSPLPEMDECIETWRDESIFSRFTLAAGIRKSRYERRTMTKPRSLITMGLSDLSVCRSY